MGMGICHFVDTSKNINGAQWPCRFYQRWLVSILQSVKPCTAVYIHLLLLMLYRGLRIFLEVYIFSPSNNHLVMILGWFCIFVCGGDSWGVGGDMEGMLYDLFLVCFSCSLGGLAQHSSQELNRDEVPEIPKSTLPFGFCGQICLPKDFIPLSHLFECIFKAAQ